jgi:hypothetical protein
MLRRLPVYIAFFAAIAVGAALSAGGAGAAPEVRPGAPAPAFAAFDVDGRPVYLRNFAGKIIVLEWTNDACPFCGKHYNSGNMQALQRKYTGEGVVWLTIASSGTMTATEARADLARWHAAPTDFCSILVLRWLSSTMRARRRTWSSSAATDGSSIWGPSTTGPRPISTTSRQRTITSPPHSTRSPLANRWR